jgi:hypothetical protein
VCWQRERDSSERERVSREFGESLEKVWKGESLERVLQRAFGESLEGVL